jgi:uncharacterized protein (TIGR02611 family)
MIKQKLEQSWQSLKQGRPGSRFQDRHARRQRSAHGRTRLGRVLYVLAAIGIILAGVFFLPAPGPGTLILLVGVGMLAGESRAAARALDWAELRLRASSRWALRFWRRSSDPQRAMLLALAVTLAAAVGYGSFQLLFGGG